MSVRSASFDSSEASFVRASSTSESEFASDSAANAPSFVGGAPFADLRSPGVLVASGLVYAMS